jgi:hypothetical protein
METVARPQPEINDSEPRTKAEMLRDRTRKPRTLDVVFDGIPADLQGWPQWVLWRWVWKDDDESPEKSKWAKVPYRCDGRGTAKVDDPATFGTFDAARAAYQAGGYDGVGFVFTGDDPFFGLDGDGCRDPDHGDLTAAAEDVVKSFNTFAEASPTATGFKAIGRGKPPAGRKRRGPWEVYSSGRYFTVTGRRLPMAPAAVTECQAALDRFHAQYIDGGTPKPGPKLSHRPRANHPTVDLSDDDLLARIRRSSRGEKFRRLYDRGDTAGYPSDSEADLALCSRLAFWCRGDRDRIDRLFRASKLYRDKWDRTDYRDGTIDKALDGRTEFYDPGGGHEANGRADGGGTDDGRKTGTRIIREYFERRYRPRFQIGNAIRAGDGRDVPMAEACGSPDSGLIAALAAATNAPTYAGVGVKWQSLPTFFKTWARVAWGDLLHDLPDEDDAELAVLGTARDEFRRWVRDAMLSEVTLGETKKPDRLTELNVERNSLIGWCDRFGKTGPWRRIRGKLCWCRRVEHEGGELELQVAVKHGLFGQVKAEPKLRAMTEWKFTRRAKKY